MDRLKELLEQDQNVELNKYVQKSLISPEDEEVEVYAFTIEEALRTAAESLDTSIVNLEYEVIERGTNGFLGFFRKPYKISIKKTGSLSTVNAENKGDLNLQIDFDAHNEVFMNQNGTFKITVTKSGAFLKVDPPKGDGTSVSEREITITLQRKQIPNVDASLVSQVIKKEEGAWVRIGDYKPSNYDSILQVQVSPDEMKSFINMTKPEKYGRVLEFDEIVSILKSKNVHFGIKNDVIKDALENELFNMPILAAEGTPSIDGSDAEIQYHFKTGNDSVQFSMEENGNIDFHKLDIIQSVVVGQILATKTLPTRGTSGKTVTGRITVAKDGRDVAMLPGKNAHLSPDGLQIIADINGQVIFKNGRVHVEPVLEIPGDVDLSSGDINFPGNVIIRGNINDTFKVYAGGNIEVNGNIGKAEVVAEGNLIVRQGIQGKDEAKIICGGNLFALFVERSILNIEGDIIIKEVLLHSQVNCKSNIYCTGGKRSQIAGGTVRALYQINAKNLGAEAYTETILEAGIDPEAEEKLIDLNKRKDEVSKELKTMGKELTNLSMLLATGPLPPEKEERFNDLTVEKLKLKDEMEELENEHDKTQAYLDSLGKDAKISASKITYPGVKIKIKNLILSVKSEYKFVTFHRDSGNIKVVPYEKAKEADEKLKEAQNRKRLR